MSDEHLQAAIDVRHVLDEFRYFWGAARERYQSPDEFAFSLNAAIQAARNITFRAQAGGKSANGFQAWYLAWQECFKADEIMAWLNASRRSIVHLSGLRKNSMARMRLLFAYDWDVLMSKDIDLDTPLDEIAAAFRDALPDYFEGNVLIDIERRWEADELQGREILEALTHAYRLLAAFVCDFGRLVDRAPLGCERSVAESAALPAEMLVPALTERLCVDPYTGRRYGDQEQDSAISDAPRPRGAHDGSVPESELPSSPFEFAEGVVLPRVVEVIGEGDSLEPLVMLHVSEGGWHVSMLAFEDTLDKLRLAFRLADLAERRGYDGLVMASEAWYLEASDQDVDWDSIFPPDIASMPSKSEAVQVAAMDSSGRTEAWLVPLFDGPTRRVAGEAIHVETEECCLGFGMPLLRAWQTRS